MGRTEENKTKDYLVAGKLKLPLLICCLAGLVSCQSSIIERARETTAGFTSVIKNLPSAVLPSEFESSAFLDRDFSLNNASIEPDGAYTVLKTYFATSRDFTEDEDENLTFRDRRGEGVTFGKAYLTLRRYSDTFDIEPQNLVKVDINEDAEDAALSYSGVMDYEDFPAELNSSINETNSSSVLIYVHGINVSFEDAAIQTAQLSYDIGFSGTTVFYSWPARGDSLAYIADAQRAQAAERAFETVIHQLAGNTSSQKVYLVANGIGARLVSRSLKAALLSDSNLRSKLKEIILIKPDIAVEEFRNEIIPFIADLTSPITVYASSTQPLLDCADRLNTNLSCDPSVEASITGITLLKNAMPVDTNSSPFPLFDGVETIDGGDVDMTLSVHSGFENNNSIVAELRKLILFDTRANSRNTLRAKHTDQGTYWEYKQ